MVFYDSIHTGVWRVSLNEQYIWRWLRKTGIQIPLHNIDVARIAYLVEDELNSTTFENSINVNEIICKIYYNLYGKNSKH